MTDHDALLEAAEEAIDAIFGDRSVPQLTTQESLQTLAGMCEDRIAAIDADLARQQEVPDD
jgi:hypothetical protein